MKTAVDCKDRLFDLLKERDTAILLDNIDKLLDTLELTLGLWVELGYAYKGYELARECIKHCNRLDSYCQHYRRLGRIAKLRDRASKIETDYFKAQHEYLHGDTR